MDNNIPYHSEHYKKHPAMREHREVWLAGFGNLVDFMQSDENEDIPTVQTDIDYFNTLEGSEGSEDMFLYFSEFDPEDITQGALDSYLRNIKIADQKPTEKALDQLFEDLRSNDENTRKKADKYIQIYLRWLRHRSKTYQEAQEKREKVRPEHDHRSMPMTNWLLEAGPGNYSIKNGFHAYVDGFKNGTGTEKAVMLAGTIACLWLLKKGYDVLPDKAKKPLRILFFLGAATVTADAIYGVYDRAKNPTEKDWRDANKEKHLKQVSDDLKTSGPLPPEFLNEIENSEKFTYVIMNLMNLTTDQFEQLYWDHFDAKQIPPDAPGYPKKPFSMEDELRAGITPTQRFETLKEVADALGFLHGGRLEIPPEKRGQKILYLAMDWGAHLNPPAAPNPQPPPVI
ncbi:hypothetical protein KKC44_02205 [Patescibacteria group bacterium]|nr:hypothetical protein [Patescibacteria group bacterium]MBU2259396.1 hypothetical protein [Patescibacteria group bacterium]